MTLSALHRPEAGRLDVVLLDAAGQQVAQGADEAGATVLDFEPLDAGNDTCVNSTTEACSSGGALVYQFCRTEGDTACYLRREGTSYACEACGEVGACDFALLDLLAEQCPAN